MKKIFLYINKNKYIILLIILYTFLFLQMQNVVLYDDDFDVIYPVYQTQDLTNKINYIFSKMNYFWFEWSGRLVGHFIVTGGLSLFGIQFFRILNPIFIFLLSFYISKIILIYKKEDLKKILFYVSLLFCTSNIFLLRETFYWTYGGILYVWSFAILTIILYIICFYKKNNMKIPLIKKIIISILIFIITFTLEQYSFILICIFGYFLLKSIINKKINCNYLYFLLITILLFMISYFAPGNLAHKQILVNDFNEFTTKINIFEKMFSKYETIISCLCKSSFLGLQFVITSSLILLKNKKINLFMIVGNLAIILDKFFNLFPSIPISIDNDSLFFDFTFFNVIYVVFFSLYLASYIYIVYKYLNTKLSALMILAIASSVLPIICIRYIGFRYFFLINIILLIIFVYSIQDIKHRINIYEYVYIILSIFYFANLYNNYYINKQIYYYNEKNIINNNSVMINIKEIPYSRNKYSWHTYYNDFANEHKYYIYLYPNINKYYGCNTNNIIYQTGD